MPGVIPDNFIQDLLSRVDIVDVIGLRLTLKKSGSNFSAVCPFHSEKTASFSVNRQKQFYYCFGCHKSGDAIQFLIDYEKISFVDAIETLASLAGIEVPKINKDNKPELGLSQQSKDEFRQIYDCLAAAKDFYCQNLHKNNPNSAPAIEYLKGRGIKGITAKKYNIGFVVDTWDSLLKSLRDKFSLSILEKAGLVIKNSKGNWFDRFRGRIIFPIVDIRGRTIGFGGRIIDKGEPKYLNSPETPVFNKSKELYGLFENKNQIYNSDHILVVEGYMDVVSLSNSGIDNAVATLGTSITEQHLKSLTKIKKQIVFCFDGDSAGQKALWRALELCLCMLDGTLKINFLVLPDNHDPDSYIQEFGTEEFNNTVKKSMSIYDYIFYKQSLDLDLEHIEGKSSLIARVEPIIKAIKVDFLQDMLFERLALLTGIDKAVLSKSSTSTERSLATNQKFKNFSQFSKFKKFTKPALTSFKKPQAQVSPAMRAAALLFINRNLVKLLPENLEVMKNLNLSGMKFFVSLAKVLKDNPESNDLEIKSKLSGDLSKHFDPKQLGAHASFVPNDGMEQEFIGNLEYLDRAAINQELDTLLAKAKSGELSQEGKHKLQELLNTSKDM